MSKFRFHPTHCLTLYHAVDDADVYQERSALIAHLQGRDNLFVCMAVITGRIQSCRDVTAIKLS